MKLSSAKVCLNIPLSFQIRTKKFFSILSANFQNRFSSFILYELSTMASLSFKFRPFLSKSCQLSNLSSKSLSTSTSRLHQQIDKSDQDHEILGKCTKEHDETIYQGILSAQIKLVKGFSLTTSAIGLSCQPILFMKMQAATNVALIAGTGAFMAFFTLATPVLIHHVSKKYVTELNYNKLEDSYTAITYSFFLRRKEVRSSWNVEFYYLIIIIAFHNCASMTCVVNSRALILIVNDPFKFVSQFQFKPREHFNIIELLFWRFNCVECLVFYRVDHKFGNALFCWLRVCWCR